MPRIRRSGAALLCNPVREGADDGGGAAGDTQPFVDVFQVGAHGSLGDAQPPGDLGVGVTGRQQAHQLVLPGGEPGDRMAAPPGVQAGLVQVRAQQYQQRPVPLGERASPFRRPSPECSSRKWSSRAPFAADLTLRHPAPAWISAEHRMADAPGAR